MATHLLKAVPGGLHRVEEAASISRAHSERSAQGVRLLHACAGKQEQCMVMHDNAPFICVLPASSP